MKSSNRHHYLPEFYIKGFIGDDGKLSVYNKAKDKIDKLRKSPKQVFFEWNRNTFEIQGEKTDFVEKLYKFGEDKFAPTYHKIIEQNHNYHLDAYDLFQIMLFILVTHWRVPNQDSDMNEYISNLTQEKASFGIKNYKTGENAPTKLFNRIIKEPAFMEGSKILRAIEEFQKSNKIENVDFWKIAFIPDSNPRLHLLSDNPVITESDYSNNILNDLLIFPISSLISVYNTKGKAIKQIPPEYVMYIDILSFIQADNLVCGPDQDYLLLISKLSKFYDTKDKIQDLRNKIFRLFQ